MITINENFIIHLLLQTIKHRKNLDKNLNPNSLYYINLAAKKNRQNNLILFPNLRIYCAYWQRGVYLRSANKQPTRALVALRRRNTVFSIADLDSLRQPPLRVHEPFGRSHSPPRGVPLGFFTPITDLDNNVGRASSRAACSPPPPQSSWVGIRRRSIVGLLRISNIQRKISLNLRWI